MSVNHFYKKQPVCFGCTGCGQCCGGDPETHYIELLAGEAERIRRYLQLSAARFQRKHLVSIEDIGTGIRINNDGRCSLLSAGNRCLVYEVRPLQCSSYPFWPEVMQSKAAWLAEGSRCEGINQGEAVSPCHIETQLARFGKQPEQ